MPLLLPRANEVWGKVMFLHLCVILFGGVSIPACITGDMTGGSLSREGDPPYGNERAVRFLLECILVKKMVSVQLTRILFSKTALYISNINWTEFFFFNT